MIAPVLLLSTLAFPVAAQANKVVDDCVADGAVDGKYSNSELNKALKAIPADSSEYSDCASTIRAAIKPASKKKSGGNPSAGASSAGGGSVKDGSGATDPDLNGDGKITAAERKAAKTKDLALKRDDTRKGTEDSLGAPRTDPTKVGALDAGDTSNGLPTPVLLAIIALALLAVAAGTILIGRRRPEFAQALRRVPIPKRFRKQ